MPASSEASASTVLVTGAAGFLGSHLVDALLTRGHRVIGVDDLSHGSRENLGTALANPAFTFHVLDVCRRDDLRNAARDARAVAHLAALKIPRYGKAVETLLVNSEGCRSALDAARELGAKFVLTSTSDVYGKNPKIPFSETGDSMLGPSTIARWAYAVSKLFDEHLALGYADAYGVPAVILRIFGSYGPRQNLTWWGGPQSVFIGNILRGEPVPVHGDGRQTRSFTYVSDTVAGIVTAIEKDAANGEVFNLGSTQEISIVELARLIKRLSGTPGELRLEFIPYEKLSGRPYEDVLRRVPDIAKARKTLGFEPIVSLEEGLRQTIEWQRALGGGVP
ncbi:MAG: GDP-mannose 4,6-dehydratase [Elusimicrobia bacterium]|nr:GDP-mannose 4,6-dehydratase [Elusimicrobiota bacterium]